MNMEIRVTVNPRKCAANQMCGIVAPGMFELGALGYSRPTRESWTEADLPMLREAEENCPTGAILVEVEGSE
jgi:ferredoxin